MAENEQKPTEQGASIALRAQYVKDLSFENPKAPQSLFSLKEPPQIEVSVNLGAARLGSGSVRTFHPHQCPRDR
jgi:preprotein translocase subunit SecB